MTDYVSVRAGVPTGQCTVTLSENAIPTYKIEENTAYDGIQVSDKLKRSKFDAFVFGTLALREEENRITVKRLLDGGIAGEIFVDLNLRAPFYTKENILFGLQNATILKVSDEELPAVVSTAFGKKANRDEMVKMIADNFKNIRIIVLTCGSEGYVAYDLTEGKSYSCSAVKTKGVSTVGSDDSFGAELLVSCLAGKDITACLSRASEVSSFVVSYSETLPDIK